MTAADSPRSKWNWRAYAAAAAIVPVNSTAFIGQFAYLRANVHWILPGIALIAVAVESIAVYLAGHAHLAMLANDSALRLKLAAYSFAAIIGGLNYSHYDAPHWRPTALAVIMFIASAISPWLWSIHSRRASRDKLLARKLVDEHAVRLGSNRWTWHPLRSTRVTSWATWHGVNDPARAIAHFASRYGTLDEDPARATVPAAIEPDGVPEIAPLGFAVAHALSAVPVSAPAPVPAAQQDVPALDLSGITPQARAALDAGGAVVMNGSVPVAVMVPETPVLNGEAHLEADASLSGGKPTQDVIDAAEMVLMGTPIESLPSVRAVAKDLLHNPNQRRLAAKLLAKRMETGTSFVQVPADGTSRAVAPGMIAPAAGFQPGGVNG